MKFTGYGIVFDPKKKKTLLSFNRTPVYETDNQYEIDLLKSCPNVSWDESEEEEEEKELTKKDVIALLEEAEIKHNPRDKKEVLLKLLEG